ncbi:uncharacterized protein LOC143294920 [Babylonia areolata]|uniref:uncharacterized protein LOC143294920 n=1 Tax=Babylonia areolata TaxID=304850 RepID=UPI003FCF23CC
MRAGTRQQFRLRCPQSHELPPPPPLPQPPPRPHPPAGMMAPDSPTANHDTTTTSSSSSSFPSPSSSSSFQDSADPASLLTYMSIGPAPLPLHPSSSSFSPSPLPTPRVPGGILTNGGERVRKSVSFRDGNLVSIREIPPRPPRTSSSSSNEEDDEEDSDEEEVEEDDSLCSESDDTDDDDDDDDDNDSEESDADVVAVVVERKKRQMGPTTRKALSLSSSSSSSCKDRTAAKKRTTTTTTTTTPPCSSSSSSSVHAPSAARADRSHASATNVTSAKGSYHVAPSAAGRVVSLVSQITGVSTAATQRHIKQRHAAATACKTAAQSKQVTAVLRVAEKKAAKKVVVSPSMGAVTTSQTVRSVQSKDRALTLTLLKAGHQGKSGKKKRVTHPLRKSLDGGGVDKRKSTTTTTTTAAAAAAAATTTQRRHSKTSTGTKSGGGGSVSGECTGRVKCRVIVTELSAVRDTLSLPPLATDNEPAAAVAASLQHHHPSTPRSHLLLPHPSPRKKTPIFNMDGFIFPGEDTAADLATRAKVKASAKAEAEEDTARLVLPVPVPVSKTCGSSLLLPRERLNGVAPPGSAGRWRRCYAWQMANGDLAGSLQEPPCITPMWETVTPVTSAPDSAPSLPSR